jgi:hypothetical protein
MAKFHGLIGYSKSEESETAPGVYSEVVTERPCSGDILRNTKRWENGDKVNDNLTIDNRFSILADEFTISNTQYMRYLKIMGSSWKITSFEIQRPRIILTVGGVYNGN